MFRSRSGRSGGSGGSVLLILCLNFLVLVVFHYLLLYHPNNTINFGSGFLKSVYIYSGWCLFPLIIVYPLMGWLADTRYGRYKMIKIGVWVMWLTSIVSSLLAIAKFKLSSFHPVFGSFDVVFFILMSLGLSLFQANIIQFGVDQLIDASSVDITSYVNWFTWTFFASEIVVDISQKCCIGGDFHFVFTIVPPVSLTVTLLLILCFGKCFVVEPATHNPLNLIFRVLRYAVKNKYPRQRSAFTYWEDKPYSRIDLAKDKYGGPFTIEEVENVKTFFRILILICIMSVFIGQGYTYMGLLPQTLNFDTSNSTKKMDDGISTCLKSWAILKLGSLLVVTVIPLYEVVFFRLCTNFLLSFTSRRKFSAGIACVVINVVIHLCLFGVRGQHLNGGSDKPPCSLYIDGKLNIQYYFVPIPKVFECFAKIWLLGSSLEFVCAQAPYSMKGLLFGMMYAVSGVFVVLTYICFLPFHIQVGHVDWSTTQMGCGFWFFVVQLVISLILSVCFMAMSCMYKNRRRSEDLPSEHFFAEGYYDCSEPKAEPMVDAST